MTKGQVPLTCNQYKQPIIQGFYYTSHPCRLNNVTYTYKNANGNDRKIHNPYVCQMPYRCNGFDKSKLAAGCRTYTLDRKRISKLLRLLEKKPKILWVYSKEIIQEEQTLTAANPIVYEPGQKLLIPQDCFSCPIYRFECEHCLGAEEKEGRRYVVCDYQRPK